MSLQHRKENYEPKRNQIIANYFRMSMLFPFVIAIDKQIPDANSASPRRAI
jgi:hypothetical protein